MENKNNVSNFYKIKTNMHVSRYKKSMNRIFGRPPGVSMHKWPRSGKYLQHHLISIDLLKLKNMLWNNYRYMSIFLPANEAQSSKADNNLTVLMREEINDLPEEDQEGLPLSYKPWWNVSSPKRELYEKGISFSLELNIDLLTIDQIQNITKGTFSIDDLDNTEDLYDFLYENSYLSGIPIWNQENQTPTDENGEPLTFLLMINGNEEHFKYSPIHGFYIYIFLEKDGQFKWVIQR